MRARGRALLGSRVGGEPRVRGGGGGGGGGGGLIAPWKVFSSPGVASWDHPPKQTVYVFECVCVCALVKSVCG